MSMNPQPCGGYTPVRDKVSQEEKTRYATTIAYSDVIKLERGRPEWVKLLIFVGAGPAL
jgi:hypothetical protein